MKFSSLATLTLALIASISAEEMSVDEGEAAEAADQLSISELAAAEAGIREGETADYGNCPSGVKVKVYTDSSCYNRAYYYTERQIQNDWNVLASTFRSSCYNNGDGEYLKWYCYSYSLYAYVYSDYRCWYGKYADSSSYSRVYMGFSYGYCQKYGNYYIKLTKAYNSRYGYSRGYYDSNYMQSSIEDAPEEDFDDEQM